MLPVRSSAIQKIRQRADLENSLFVTDQEVIDLANDQLEIAYHHCVSAYGDVAFATELVIPDIGIITPGNNPHNGDTVWPNGIASGTIQTRFPLPIDFGRLLRCEWVHGHIDSFFTTQDVPFQVNGEYHTSPPNIRWCPMHPVDLVGTVFTSERRAWLEGEVAYWIQAHGGGQLPAELGTNLNTASQFWISFLPVPNEQVSVHMLYVPLAPQWGAGDGDSIIRLPDLAWRYVREATAADLLDKQRSDSSVLRGSAGQYLADIENSKIHPDFANAPGTVDLYGGSGISPYGRRRNVW